jgi:hypothetical protein
MVNCAAGGGKPNSVWRSPEAALGTVISLTPPERGVPPSGMRLIPGNGPPKRDGPDAQRSLFCLAPHGVFRAPPVARRAVGSYPAFSPLPGIRGSTGGLFSVTLSVNGNFRSRPPRVLRGVLSGGVRTFLWQSKHPRAPATSDRLPPAAPVNVRRNRVSARGRYTRGGANHALHLAGRVGDKNRGADQNHSGRADFSGTLLIPILVMLAAFTASVTSTTC